MMLAFVGGTHRTVPLDLVELPAPPVPRTRRAEILAAAIPMFARYGFITG